MSLVVLGAGGHGREVLDVAEACGVEIAGVFDDGDPDLGPLQRRGIARLEEIAVAHTVVLGIGESKGRQRAAARLGAKVTWHEALVHPAATLGSDVTLGEGSVITAGARLTTAITVGVHCYVGPNATIGHDAVVGDLVTILPGATISGTVTLGEASTIGTGANIRQGVRIGISAVVGAGAVVLADVDDGVTVAGVPARPLR